MPYSAAPPSYTDPRYREYLDNLTALGAVNTDAKAKQYQRLFEDFHSVDLSVQHHETPVLPTAQS